MNIIIWNFKKKKKGENHFNLIIEKQKNLDKKKEEEKLVLTKI